MQRLNFLEYRDYRYLKMASALAATAVIGYWATKPSAGEAYGGTWFGYVSGLASMLLVLILVWYGVRKRITPKVADRRRGSRRKLMQSAATGMPGKRHAERRKISAEDHWRYGGTLQGWLSAHAYLGLALLCLISVHSGFRFGWNAQTLAYFLVLLVALSGGYGAFAYLRYPRMITENLGEDSLDGLLLKIAELDELARVRALALPDEVNALVSLTRQRTRFGGNFIQQLRSSPRDCPTGIALQRIHELAKQLVEGNQPKLMRDLYSVLVQKQRLGQRVRTAIGLNARMQFWLYLHVPLSVALLAALLAHLLALLIYW